MIVSFREFKSHYLSLEEHPDAVVVGLKIPRLTEEFNLDEIGHELFALVEEYECRRLVVSLGSIEYVTSSGIAKLISLHRKMHRLQGVVAFCDLTPLVADILSRNKLTSYFTIAANVADGIELVQPAPNSP